MKEDEIIFEEKWKMYPFIWRTLGNIVSFGTMKPLCKDWFLVGFNNAIDYTFKKIEEENIENAPKHQS